MSAANWRRMMVTGALPGRNPGIRATRAISRAAFSLALLTFAAGISSSISRLQVASVIGIFSGLHRREKAELQLALVCLFTCSHCEKEAAGKRRGRLAPREPQV